MRLRWRSCRKRASGHIGSVSGSTMTLCNLSRNSNERMIHSARVPRTADRGGRGGGPGVSTRIAYRGGAAGRHRRVTGARTKRSQRIPPVPRRPPGASLFTHDVDPLDRTNQTAMGLVRVKSARPRTSAASRAGAWTVPCQPIRRVVRVPDPVRSCPCRSLARDARNVRPFTIAYRVNCDRPHAFPGADAAGQHDGS